MLDKKWLFLLIPATAALVFGAPSLLYPFGFDQANQAYIGSRVLDGEILFRDVASLKPPFAILFHSLSQLTFGHNMTAVRIADLVWTMLTCMILTVCFGIAFGERWRKIAPLTGILYAHYYYSYSHWHTAQADGWMNLPLTAAMCLIVLGFNRIRDSHLSLFLRWSGIGLMGICAILFKYPAVAILGIFFMASVLNFSSSFKEKVLEVAGLFAGLFVGLGASVLVLTLFDAWNAFLSDHLKSVVIYSGVGLVSDQGGGLPARMLGLVTRVGQVDYLLKWITSAPWTYMLGAVGVVGTFLLVGKRSESAVWRTRYILVLGWLGGAWISVAVQGRFFPYHFLPMFAPGVILAVLGLGWLWQIMRAHLESKWIKACLVSIFIVIVVIGNIIPYYPSHFSVPWQWHQLSKVVFGNISLNENWRDRQYEVSPNFPVKHTLETTDFINRISAPDDSLFVWGTNMALYFLSRKSKNVSVDSSLQAVGTVMIPGGQKGGDYLLDEMRSHPPTLVVVQRFDSIPWILHHDKDSYQLLQESKPIKRFMDDNYEELKRIGEFIVFGVIKKEVQTEGDKK